jgi:hypothetical protein
MSEVVFAKDERTPEQQILELKKTKKAAFAPWEKYIENVSLSYERDSDGDPWFFAKVTLKKRRFGFMKVNKVLKLGYITQCKGRTLCSTISEVLARLQPGADQRESIICAMDEMVGAKQYNKIILSRA